MPSMGRGANLPKMGEFNQNAVLDCIRRRPEGVSRTEIAALTGLANQTVSNVTRRLLRDGLIRESGRVLSGPGKPRTLLQLNGASRFSIGVHLDPSVTSVTALNFAGEIVANRLLWSLHEDDPETFLIEIEDTVGRMVMDLRIDEAVLAGVGLAVPGPVDAVRGVVVNPPLLPGWHNVSFRSALAERLGCRVEMEKDVVAAAVGEMWHRPADEGSSFLFVYLGTGIGAGAVIRGQVLRGATDNFGEVGRFRVADSTEALGRSDGSCTIGNLISPARIVALGRDAGLVGEQGDTVEDRYRAIAGLARAGESRASAILQEAATHLARGVAQLSDVLDLDEVVFGGPWWDPISDIVMPNVAAALTDLAVLTSVRPVTLRTSRHSHDAASVGAAALVLDETFSARPERLVMPGLIAAR